MRKRTGRITVLGSLITAGVLWFGTTAAQAGTITVGMVDGTAGQQVVVDVTLQPAGSEQIAGTQNDVTAATGVAIAPKSSGKCSTATPTIICSADADCPAGQFCKKAPDCAVNPVILKGGTTFGFLPSGCSGAACTGVRALVFALDNTDPIPPNVTIYSCKVNVAAAASGTIALTASGVTCSNATGGDVVCTGVNGSVTVGGGPTGPTIVIGTANAMPGDQGVGVDVKLNGAGAVIAGTQNDITPAAGAVVAPKSSGKCSTATTTTCSADADCPAGQFCKKAPDCAVNPAIMKAGTTFGFLPSGCSGAACTGVRALVFALDNTDPIPDNVTMYTCKFNVAATASGTIVLTNSNVTCSGPTGDDVPCTGVTGAIILGGRPTATPTPTNTPAATATPTRTVPPTATRTSTTAPPLTPIPGGGGMDEDGCQIGAPGSSGAAWLLLIPLAGLIVSRRRPR